MLPVSCRPVCANIWYTFNEARLTRSRMLVLGEIGNSNSVLLSAGPNSGRSGHCEIAAVTFKYLGKGLERGFWCTRRHREACRWTTVAHASHKPDAKDDPLGSEKIAGLFDLSGQTALVTGAASGIGRWMASALALAGAQVVLTARREPELSNAKREIEFEGGKAAAIPWDLAERDRLDALASEAAKLFGPVTILVNAAGINLREAADEVTPQGWDRTHHLHLDVPFFLAQSLVPEMKAAGVGRIINLASLQSVRAFPDGIAYGAAKGGVVQLTRAMAEAWSRYGITANAIAPGFFRTALTESLFNNTARLKWVVDQTAIGRTGLPEDLYGIAVFLASRASNYITGQTIFVDGGWTAK